MELWIKSSRHGQEPLAASSELRQRRTLRRMRQRTLTMRSPAGALGAVAADCVMMTGCPATVSVPVRDDEPVFAVTR